ncbi:Ig-like domain-containing protein [Candidatus Shapirobacteria bacterium]|nr:Ig-like domain-containing protein [Candidatus Shapirobacteria bacterium]
MMIKKRLLIILGIALLLTLIKFFIWPKFSSHLPNLGKKINLNSQADITLVATKKDNSGILPNTTFLLSSQAPLNTAELEQSLTIIPALSLEIKQTKENEWEITPSKELAKGEIYQFKLPSLIGGVQAQEISWAFQVQTPLEITGSLPADKITDVPLNSPIEIYFNNPEFTPDQNYLEINPSLDGHWEKHQNTLVFVPQKLTSTTIYTVKVKKGLVLSGSEETLAQDYVFQFETGEEEKVRTPRFNFTRSLFETSPDLPPTILIGNWQPPSSQTKGKLYQVSEHNFKNCLEEKISLPDWAQYSQTLHRCSINQPPNSEFDLEVKRINDTAPQSYFELPEKLTPGYYFLEIENPGTHSSQVLIQSTPLSWYLWVGDKETVFWTNDLQTKQPAGGTAIFQDSQKIAQTDNEGMAEIKTPNSLKESKNHLLTLEQGANKAYVLLLGTSNWSSNGPTESKVQVKANEYWSYLYFDRQLYAPQDKINFWGIIKPREKGRINQAKAKLAKGYYSFWSEKVDQGVTLIEEKEISLSPQGTFISQFDLSQLPPGSYSIGIFDEKTLINSKYFSIQTFSKPAYKIEAIPERVAIWAGETNKIKIKASFWDGTPVSNTTLAWQNYQKDTKGEITTNRIGEATLEVKTNYESREYWPDYWNLDFHPKLPQEAEINTSVSFYTFGPKINLSGKTEWENNQATTTIKAIKLDLEKLQASPWDKKGEPVASQKIKTMVYYTWQEKIETGEVYDPIDKRIIKQYRYEKRQEMIKEEELTTNAQGEAILNFPAQEEKSYEIILTAEDENGRIENTKLHLWAGSQREATSQLTIESNATSFKVGEKVKLTLATQSPLPEESFHFLIIGSQNGKNVFRKNQTSNQLELEFKEEFIPNLEIRAICFTGNTYWSSQNWDMFSRGALSLRFNSENKELNLEIKTNKEKYEPGEEVKVEILAADYQNQPRQTRLLVSAVDEALSDLDAIPSPNLLSTLYRSIGEGRIISYTSHPRPQEELQAEGGGGGGLRENFQNTAVFQEVETDSQGKANLSFKLPDNITSWRITSVALSEALEAGEGEYLIPVSKPIFVNLISNEEFISSDQPQITAIAYGDLIDNDQNIDYTLKAPSLGIGVQKISKKGFEPVDFSLKSLEPGEHKIEIWAENQGKKDGLAKTIKVVKSRLSREVSEYQELNQKIKPAWSTQKTAVVTVVDKSQGFWYPYLIALSRLDIYGKNERVDRLATQLKVRQLLNNYFGTNLTKESNISHYQREGGFVLTPQSSPDLFLSSKIAALGLEETDKISLKRYLWEQFNQEKSIERASAALWGLAELEEPVLNTIINLKKEENTTLGKIFLGLAASALGDQATGQELYQEVVNLGKSKEMDIETTALAMVLGGKIGNDLAEKMWYFLNDNPSQENLYVTEKAIFLKSFLEKSLTDPGVFSYRLDGKTKKQTLESGKAYQILVSPSQTDSFEIEPVSGRLGYIAQWWEGYQPNESDYDQQIKLNLTSNPQGKISTGQVVEIKAQSQINANALSEPYLVTISLPSGLRYIKAPYSWQTIEEKSNKHYSYPLFQEGNQLVFRADPSDPIYFLARPINKGNFTFEPAIIYHSVSKDSFNLSSPPPDIIIQ